MISFYYHYTGPTLCNHLPEKRRWKLTHIIKWIATLINGPKKLTGTTLLNPLGLTFQQYPQITMLRCHKSLFNDNHKSPFSDAMNRLPAEATNRCPAHSTNYPAMGVPSFYRRLVDKYQKIVVAVKEERTTKDENGVQFIDTDYYKSSFSWWSLLQIVVQRIGRTTLTWSVGALGILLRNWIRRETSHKQLWM